MRLRIFHRTHYHYRALVRDSHNEIRLRPATHDVGRLESFLLTVNPPVRLRHFRDPWLNYVHYFDIPEPHLELVIEAQSIINTTNPYAEQFPSASPLNALTDEEASMLRPFLGSSRYVQVSPEIWRMALDIVQDIEDGFDCARKIMEHIYNTFAYAPNATTASTHMAEVIQDRKGVCQDFSHVMIGLCRALNIPARYVSGYLYNGPESQLRGAQASHAWCEVFLPGQGWFGLDPTNNTLADDRHVKIATGRDYEDAAPVTGQFDGPPGATSALKISLTLERLDS